MYYSSNSKKSPKTIYLTFTAFFLFSISFWANHTNVFAELLDPTAEEYRVKGYEAQKKGLFQEALGHYAKALSLDEDNAVLCNDVGILYEQLGIWERAEAYYLKSIQIDQNYLPPYTNLAYFYEQQGDDANAIFYFQERLRRASEDDPWREKVEEELYRLNPLMKQELVQQKAEALARDLQDQARQEFSLQITRADKHHQTGLQFMAEKKFDEAILEFDRALILTPDNPKIVEARERAQYERTLTGIKDRTDQAIQKLDEGELDSAKEDFQEILATIPEELNQVSH